MIFQNGTSINAKTKTEGVVFYGNFQECPFSCLPILSCVEARRKRNLWFALEYFGENGF